MGALAAITMEQSCPVFPCFGYSRGINIKAGGLLELEWIFSVLANEIKFCSAGRCIGTTVQPISICVLVEQMTSEGSVIKHTKALRTRMEEPSGE